MKKALTKKVTAAITLAAMTMSAVACGEKPVETQPAETTAPETTVAAETTPAAEETEVVAEDLGEFDPYADVLDENGNLVDFGGMEIIIRDWWSNPDNIQPPANDYEEARDAWREEVQEKYHFTVVQQAISDWTSAPSDFVDYCTTGDDGNNYVFVLRDDPALTSAMANGLCYDLATLDCLNFNARMFMQNKTHIQYSMGDHIYCMCAGFSEPRTGVYFNKRILTEAGIDPESIYDAQADGTWTWAKFEELLTQVQQDTDNDGTIDIYGFATNAGDTMKACVYSNGGSFIGKDETTGLFTYNLENPETLEGLEEGVKMFANWYKPAEEGQEWDYYKDVFKNGQSAFLIDDFYAGTPGNYLEGMVDEVGFVMFPKGPKGETYVNAWSNNPIAIPGCYDADKAWKLALAWRLWNTMPEEFETYNATLSTARNGLFDERAVEETVTMMMEPEHGMVTFHGTVPDLNLNSEFIWPYSNKDTVVSEAVESVRDTWNAYLDAVNSKIK